MCERCAELEERVAWLESELGLQRDVERRDRLRSVLRSVIFDGRREGGRSGGVAMVLALYDAKGRPMTRAQIMEAVPPVDGGDDERHPKIVDVWVCWARKGLGRDAIENVWGRGYRMTSAGVAKVAAILGEAVGRSPQALDAAA